MPGPRPQEASDNQGRPDPGSERGLGKPRVCVPPGSEVAARGPSVVASGAE